MRRTRSTRRRPSTGVKQAWMRRSPGGWPGDTSYQAIQQIHGVGPVLAAVFVAEIGDTDRFQWPEQLCCWAGMSPRHRESDAKTRRDRITKQGSKLVRCATVEAVQRAPSGSGGMRGLRDRIVEHRGAAA